MVCVRTFTNFLLIEQFVARFLFLERLSQEFDLDTVYDSRKKSRKFRKRIFNKNSKGSHDQWVTCGWRCSWLFHFPCSASTDLTVNELVDKFEVKFYINATLSLISNLTNNCSKKVVMSAFEARWISVSINRLIAKIKEGKILVLNWAWPERQLEPCRNKFPKSADFFYYCVKTAKSNMLSNFENILSIILVFEVWEKNMTQSAAQCWNSAFDVRSS